MTRWIKKIHMYVGLLNFTVLVIFGVVGIAATVLPDPNKRPKPAPSARVIDYQAPGGLDDRGLADHVHATAKIPLTGTAPDWGIRRDSENNLRIRFGTAAARFETTLFEREGKLRIEKQPFDTLQFLFHLHEMTPSSAHPDFRTQLWAWYVEFAIWSLILMALSGVYLWLASRPRHRWAQVSLAASMAVFIAFYWVIR
ncbi:MAG: PepSY domain-containing protein [Acidobacteria bacterium]|nr:PepSY domain-containing protein [Acidobacteriota bacterium]